MDMAVGKLSGGEQSRLLLAKLMLQSANVLVLDEPTNDLDMATLGVLEDCLTDFSGAVILVTHDRYFLDQVATRILGFNSFRPQEGKITSFEDLGQWDTWYSEQARLAKSDAKKAADALKAQAAASSSKKRKLSYNEQREFDEMEPKIHKAEALLKQLTAESLLPENHTNAVRQAAIAQTMAETQAEIDRLYARWAELE
jgi:ATP-binding cassette subfamily F protein uup